MAKALSVLGIRVNASPGAVAVMIYLRGGGWEGNGLLSGVDWSFVRPIFVKSRRGALF